METEDLRNLLCFLGICLVVVGSVLAFNQTTKRSEFRPLLESGQKINLNVFTLLAAYLRKDDDPLKPAHKRIAKIGILYFFGMISGIVVVPTIIIIVLLAAGVR